MRSASVVACAAVPRAIEPHARRTLWATLAAVVATASPALANPAGDVPGGANGPVVLGIDYEYELDATHITREQAGRAGADPLGPVPRRRELDFEQSRHVVVPRLELGATGRAWLSFAAPIVIAQNRTLDVAGDRGASSTFDDGLLTGTGYDAQDPTTPPTGRRAFRGVARSGVPELRVGLGFAPMSQALDDTKPTWKLGGELRLAVGRIMRFNAADPAAETGVSTGVHELRLWTSVDRRYRYFEATFDAFYQRPIATRDHSLFQDPGYGSSNTELGQTAGGGAAIEAYLVDDRATGNRVSVELGGRLTARFEGRGYTELWELFALAGDRRLGGPLVLDGDPTTDDVQPVSHPGISNYESYLETAARLAVRGRLGSHVSFSVFGELIWKTDHTISFADGGIDLPTCPTDAPRCETDANNLINPGTQEVNPLYSRRIDLVGHRYRSEDNLGVAIGVQAQLLF